MRFETQPLSINQGAILAVAALGSMVAAATDRVSSVSPVAASLLPQSAGNFDLARCDIHRARPRDGWVRGELQIVGHRRGYAPERLTQPETVIYRVGGVLNRVNFGPGEDVKTGDWVQAEANGALTPLGPVRVFEGPADDTTLYNCTGGEQVSLESMTLRTEVMNSDGTFSDTNPATFKKGDRVRDVDHKTHKEEVSSTPTQTPEPTRTPVIPPAPQLPRTGDGSSLMP